MRNSTKCKTGRRTRKTERDTPMRLYFIPFACSLAVRAALVEAGLSADFIQVGPGEHPLPDGRSFRDIHALGQVPVLELDDGAVLTEGPAILQYIADRAPDAGLAPATGTRERLHLQQWLNFVSTELHKLVFTPLMSRDAPEEARAYARTLAAPRLAYLSGHLGSRDFLLGRYSVADAYLLAVLNWCESAGIDIAAWPVLNAYRSRLRQWPSIAEAMRAERPLLNAA